ncbi:tRNA lysidine(34) synthetase TilS [Bacillus sp. PS06]|uniref:tRNA lysidine(34) synthetase TilS n=1 Tax=Bacillus sp. PS06 TaxID=2764176 RepID=UPI001CD84E57|nr:tRNA lysidine(34) synthetase TilS [Bacillus sp. PS06]
MKLGQVDEFIKKQKLSLDRSIILVGVSGGPDSLALLHYLWKNYSKNSSRIIAIHVDHMFRGIESENDRLFVEEFCHTRGIPIESTSINVSAHQQKYGKSAQVAARDCRYKFFEEMMEKHKGDYLALGHHGDDQVETMLMRLARGGTTTSNAGIRVKRKFATGYILRPFLSLTKEDISEYCVYHHLTPRHDPSNDQDKYTRNRFRHHVLPFLKQENPQVHLRFQQFSEQLLEDEELLQELTLQKMNTVIKRNDQDHITISVSKFKEVPKPLQRRAIQLILNYLYKDTSPDLNSIHIDNLLSFLVKEHPSGEQHFPLGLRIVRSYDDCHFRFLEKKAEPYSFILGEESTIQCSNGYELVTQRREVYPKGLNGNDVFIIDPERIELPLYVRTRKTGDKMTQKGMKGTKKVKDIFIDQKVDRALRDLWPIVTDSKGRILWIPLLKKSSFEASDLSKDKYIILKYKATNSRGQS